LYLPVHDDCDDQDDALRDPLPKRLNSGEVQPIRKHRDDERADDRSDDPAFATRKAGTTDDDRCDDLECPPSAPTEQFGLIA
jgi:hypothetical protein